VAGACDTGAGATLGVGVGTAGLAGTTVVVLGVTTGRDGVALLLVGMGVIVLAAGAAPPDAGGKGVIGCEPNGAGGTTVVGRVGVGPDGLDTRPPEMESG
jgi:hypothetical protein